MSQRLTKDQTDDLRGILQTLEIASKKLNPDNPSPDDISENLHLSAIATQYLASFIVDNGYKKKNS